MNTEIPTSTTTAPIPMARALLPLSPLSLPVEEVVAVVVTVGVLAVGTAAGDCGTPGENGVPPLPGLKFDDGAVTAAAAEPASVADATVSAATTSIRANRLRTGASAPKRAAAPSPWCQAA